MYPLKVVLIGCRDDESPELRHELAEQGCPLEGDFPDVKTAISGLATPPETKRLFVFHVRTPVDLRQLERLNDMFLGNPILALVVGTPEAPLLMSAMRAGAAQVVSLPINPDDFKLALLRIARQFGHRSVSTVVAVSGVSEGCGATMLSINLASEIAHLYNLPTILVEMALQMGRLPSQLNIEPRYTTRELIQEIDRIDLEVVRQALSPVGENFSVLTGPAKGIAPAAIAPGNVVRLVDYVRRLANVVLLDMPYTFDDTYFQTIVTAEHVVLVANPTVPSIHALKTVRDTLAKHEGIGAIHLVINRYDRHHSACSLSHLHELLQTEHLSLIANEYETMEQAANNGTVIRAQNPHSRALSDIDRLAALLLGTRTMQQRGRVSQFFHTLLHGGAG
jgi:pilus assembly protein CpaE